MTGSAALARTRVRRFSIFPFTASPTCRNGLCTTVLGVKTLGRAPSPSLHPWLHRRISGIYPISLLARCTCRPRKRPPCGSDDRGEGGERKVFTHNGPIVSTLRGVGEAVKGKNEKWLTGARYAYARDSTLPPRGGSYPPAERKKRGRTTKKLGGGDGKRATFRPHEARREQRPRSTADHRGPMQKKAGERRRNRGGFRNFAPQTGHAPSGADFRPHRSDRPPQCDETLPLACHLKTAVRLIFPRL